MDRTSNAIALVLIIGTVFVKKQHDHLQSVELGFNKEQVILIPVRAPMYNVYMSVFPELKKISGVKAVSWANDIIGKKHNTHEFNWGDMEQGKWTYLPPLYCNPEWASRWRRAPTKTGPRRGRAPTAKPSAPPKTPCRRPPGIAGCMP